MNLTEVARMLNRTPGATRDYLRWLEEVGLLEGRQKRFFFAQPIIRLWLRLYGTGRVLDEADHRNEVHSYLESCQEQEGEVAVEVKAQNDGAEPPPDSRDEDSDDYTYPEQPAREEAELLVEID